jgi:hypothetical protein
VTGKVFTAVSRSSSSPIDNGKTPDFMQMMLSGAWLGRARLHAAKGRPDKNNLHC